MTFDELCRSSYSGEPTSGVNADAALCDSFLAVSPRPGSKTSCPRTCFAFASIHRLAARLLVLFALLGACAAPLRADTEINVFAGASDLDKLASYQGSTWPDVTGNLTFVNRLYARTSFTLNSFSLGIGTLDDLEIIQALTDFAGQRLTLNSGSDGVAGRVAGDLPRWKLFDEKLSDQRQL